MGFHQNIVIDNRDMPSENPKRKNSRFWNEGKWDNFIRPLLPADPKDRTFIEIGSNVGLYLRMAKEYGFRTVIGVEKEKSDCEMAERYRDANKLDYKIINGTVGENFNIDDLPIADVILMANVHYYIPLEKLVKILDRFLYRTQYCIVVSRHLLKEKSFNYQYTPSGEFNGIRALFKDWEEVNACVTSKSMLVNDPHPRALWSLLFKGKLERSPIEKYLETHFFSFALRDLARSIYEGKEIDPKKTKYYHRWVQRNAIKREGKSEADILALVNRKIEMIRSLKEDGLKEKILVNMANKVIDGGTRVTVLKEFGYKSILVRRI